ncbi:hypothetical protein C2U70_30325 [Bradyrhizobium guangdongense]|uniref:hypothetical protein n=1 Tax=Bradyrhizobium guangdongense TaxID=1325090 RepID=UPI00112C4516|nr:hypothetical protein [Bradyrhizobium guangdongense]TPQ27762.1 hypothetical protein C2U70_30325 [Bradyrhizobium guangdongense]
MSDPSADVSRTVEYTMDKWRMDRVPWGLWGCVAGLAFVLHAESHGVNGAALAAVYVVLLGVVFAGFVLTVLIGQSDLPLPLDFLIGLLILIAVTIVISAVSLAVGGSIGRSGYVGVSRSLYWSNIVNPPPNVFGWMLIYFGLGWIGFALYRHVYADRPIITLSPVCIQFHRPWLNGLSIPWQEVWGVGRLEIALASGVPFIAPSAAVLVGKDFYERSIAPKRSFFEPPGADAMFRPKGAMMQVVLNSADMTVTPEEFLGPVEARWKAFRDRSGPQHDGSTGTSIVYGRWSIDGSLWQAVQFLAPVVGLVVVALTAL